MNYEWQAAVWKNCNQQSNFPSVLSLSVVLSYFYIKEKLALSTQKKSHSVDFLLFFIFSPSSLRFMWASLSSFWLCSVFVVFFSFFSWGQTGSPKPEHLSLTALHSLLCLCEAVLCTSCLRGFVCCLVVTETPLRGQARTGA